MNTSTLKKIISETGLSPEDLAPYLKVSNMTLRRMLNANSNAAIPKDYQASFREGVLELIRDQKISADSDLAQKFLSESSLLYSQSIYSILGLSQDLSKKALTTDIDETLSKIGGSMERQAEVDAHLETTKKISEKHTSLLEPVKTLIKVVTSKALSHSEKIIAYGALFYLLMPMDFVPDYLPGFGIMDDLGVLTAAALCYASKKI